MIASIVPASDSGMNAMINEWDGWAKEHQGSRECFEASLRAALVALEVQA